MRAHRARSRREALKKIGAAAGRVAVGPAARGSAASTAPSERTSRTRAALSGAAGSRRRLLGARRETERITTQVCEGRNHRAVRFLSNPSRRSEYERSQSQRRESTFGARVLPRGWATWPHRRTRACKGRSTRPAGATRAAVRACGSFASSGANSRRAVPTCTTPTAWHGPHVLSRCAGGQNE